MPAGTSLILVCLPIGTILLLRNFCPLRYGKKGRRAEERRESESGVGGEGKRRSNLVTIIGSQFRAAVLQQQSCESLDALAA